MKNSIYDLEFEDVMKIAKESNEARKRYLKSVGITEQEYNIRKQMYTEFVNDLCATYGITIKIYNKCQREYGRYLDCPVSVLEMIKTKFNKRKHPYELSLKRKQKELDFLKEEMRKELMAELGL